MSTPTPLPHVTVGTRQGRSILLGEGEGQAVPGQRGHPDLPGRGDGGRLYEPALALKEFPEYRSLYSSVPLLPAGLLRNMARYAGCHVYTEDNDVVMAGRGLITYHTVAPGPRTVRLPEPATVWDLFSGECLGESVSEVALKFEQPGTKVLTTLEEGLWR